MVATPYTGGADCFGHCWGQVWCFTPILFAECIFYIYPLAREKISGSKIRFSLLKYAQGCISCGTCSYPELTEDHVLTSAYVKIFRTVTRNAVNKSVWRKKDCFWLPLNKHAMNIWLSSLRIRAHLSWRTGKHLHVLHVLRTYPTCSYPGYQDTTTYAALSSRWMIMMSRASRWCDGIAREGMTRPDVFGLMAISIRLAADSTSQRIFWVPFLKIIFIPPWSRNVKIFSAIAGSCFEILSPPSSIISS